MRSIGLAQVVLVVATLLVPLTGCGGDGGGSDPVGNDPAPPPPAPPAIAAIAPNRGLSTGGTAVVITGSGFVPGQMVVSLAGVAMTGVTVVNGTTITATTPALPATANPSASLTVTNVVTGRFATRNLAFGYIVNLVDAAAAAGDLFGGGNLLQLGGNVADTYPGVAIAIADFDGNGFPDLAIAAPGRAAGRILVFFANAVGQFVTAALAIVGGGLSTGFGLAAAELSGDGFPDLLVGQPLQGAVAGGAGFIRTSNGALQTFAAALAVANPSETAGGRFGFSVAGGNVDGAADAVNEPLVSEPADPVNFNPAGGTVHEYDGLPGALTFRGSIPALAVSQFFGVRILVANLNGDAFPDLLVTRPGTTTRQGVVDFLLNDGVGAQFFSAPVRNSFASTLVQNNSDFGNAAAVGNVDALGVPADALIGQFRATVAALGNAGRAELLYNNNAGGVAAVTVLTEPTTEVGALFGYQVALADLDGDGDADAIVSSPGSTAGGLATAGEVHLFRSNGAARTFTFLETLTEPTPAAGALFGAGLMAADLNGDGLADLVVTNPTGGAAGSGEAFVFYTPR